VRKRLGWNRDIGAGPVALTRPRARFAAATELTLGIVGLGRIGKRMAHVSRGRVQARRPRPIRT
jgi:phosphoglycerate dehydrogenase-like enzyme